MFFKCNCLLLAIPVLNFGMLLVHVAVLSLLRVCFVVHLSMQRCDELAHCMLLFLVRERTSLHFMEVNVKSAYISPSFDRTLCGTP